MGLLWENLAQQLNAVRMTTPEPTAASVVAVSDSMDDPSDRRRRLQKALDAIKDSGNTVMIESLTAAIEGRPAVLALPELPDGITKF